MIRDFLTIAFVTLALFGTVAQQEDDNLGLRLIAATGDARRSLVRFLDLYADLKAGSHHAVTGVGRPADRGEVEA